MMNDKATLIKRDIGYTFWVFTEQAAYLAVPRLLLFPIAALLIGKQSFGVFSYALSITLILGMQPQMGLSTGLLRHLSEYGEAQRAQFLGTAMKMCHPVMFTIIAVGLVASIFAGLMHIAEWQMLNCLIPLLILLYSENQFLLILTETRFLRQFRQRAIWVTWRSVLGVIGGVIGALIGGAVGLSWGFMIGNSVLYIFLRTRYKPWFQTPYSKEMAAVLKASWLQITIAGVLTVSIPHINRIVLGSYHSYDAVADFVAATTVIFLYLAPTYCFGGLILSMLSRYSSVTQLSRRGKNYFLAIMLFGVFVLPVLMYVTGPAITRFMFPQFGEESVNLLTILVWIMPSETITALTRPFIYKFAPIKIIPIINTLSFLVILVLAFLLIPKYASRGAAWGYVAGNAFISLIGSGVCIWLFLASDTKKNPPIGVQIAEAPSK
jgi:O-antigen/teichoic acid export membrane protein